MRYRCIYCLVESELRFRREHVMPEGFGRFRHNLTIRCVCNSCNEYFGNSLERILERDSILGLMRLQSGIKPPHEAHEIGGKRLSTKIVGHEILAGAPMRFEGDETTFRAVHDEAVGFERHDGAVDWYDPNELTPEIVSRYKPWRRTRVVCREDHRDLIADHLRQLGALLYDRQPFEIEGGVVNLESSSALGEDELRVIGKIAFNYAAKFVAKDVLLRNDFDAIRAWIRFGESVEAPIVTTLETPILFDETKEWKRTTGHLVTLSWSDENTLIAQVSMFNSIGFHVKLCSRFRGVWFPIKQGHLFDLETKAVLPLRPFSLRLAL